MNLKLLTGLACGMALLLGACSSNSPPATGQTDGSGQTPGGGDGQTPDGGNGGAVEEGTEEQERLLPV